MFTSNSNNNDDLSSSEIPKPEQDLPFRATDDENYDETDSKTLPPYMCTKKRRAPGDRKQTCSPINVSNTRQNSYVYKKFVYDASTLECKLQYVNNRSLGWDTMSLCEENCRCI